MRLIRSLICTALILILLPWAAYSAAFAAPALPLASAAFAALTLQAVPLTPDPSKVSAPRTCRKAVLPGFACSPDPALHLTTRSHWQAPSKPVFPPGGDWAGRGRWDPPPGTPPRFF